MNFLAHAFLSGEDDDILIGNFIADAVKGNNLSKFREGIIKGIHLHRAIDLYTDQHPAFIQSKQRIIEQYGKFSGVVIDIYYDHFLAAGWEDHSKKDLSEFALKIYRLLLKNYALLPARSKKMLPYMIIHNWLIGYARFKDLQWVFNGMSRRSSKYDSGMENAVISLQEHYDLFKEDFNAFMPDMIEHADSIRETLVA